MVSRALLETRDFRLINLALYDLVPTFMITNGSMSFGTVTAVCALNEEHHHVLMHVGYPTEDKAMSAARNVAADISKLSLVSDFISLEEIKKIVAKN